MRVISLTWSLLFFVVSVPFAQNFFSVSFGTSATSRILIFPDNNFTDSEILELKLLEGINPSYEVNIGFTSAVTNAISLNIGLGYKKNRFGSRIYKVPLGVPTTTPQYAFLKQIPEFDQEYLFFETILKRNICSPILRVAFVYNSREKLYEASYNSGKKSLVGHLVRIDKHKNPTIKRFDVNFRVGTDIEVFNFKKSYLLIKPFASIYLRPYTILGEGYYYLYFNRNTVGYVYDFGLNIQYVFGGHAKKRT